jgi:hypothetical protein
MSKFKNFMSQNYVVGPKVYKIKSPNGRHVAFVNKNSFLSLVRSSRIPSETMLNHLVNKEFIINGKKHQASRVGSLRDGGVNFLLWHNNARGIPLNQYKFQVQGLDPYNQNRWVNVRGPFGEGIYLKNVNKYTLTNANKRNIRAAKRNNMKKEEELRRAIKRRREEAAENERRKQAQEERTRANNRASGRNRWVFQAYYNGSNNNNNNRAVSNNWYNVHGQRVNRPHPANYVPRLIPMNILNSFQNGYYLQNPNGRTISRVAGYVMR